MLYLVFKAANAPEDAEWEDDPMPGEILVGVLDDDDEVIEPAKAVFLGMDLEDFIVSDNFLPLGALLLILFCTRRRNQAECGFFPEKSGKNKASAGTADAVFNRYNGRKLP